MARVMMMAGGSGGHGFPALAVAAELQGRGAEVFWLGTRRGLEAKLVPTAGIDMEWLSVSGLRGKSAGTLLLAPYQLLRAAAQVQMEKMRQRPTEVRGAGGAPARAHRCGGAGGGTVPGGGPRLSNQRCTTARPWRANACGASRTFTSSASAALVWAASPRCCAISVITCQVPISRTMRSPAGWPGSAPRSTSATAVIG